MQLRGYLRKDQQGEAAHYVLAEPLPLDREESRMPLGPFCFQRFAAITLSMNENRAPELLHVQLNAACAEAAAKYGEKSREFAAADAKLTEISSRLPTAMDPEPRWK